MSLLSSAHLFYKQHRNKVHRKINNAKRSFFLKGSKKGSKAFWRHIKSSSSLGRIKQLFLPWPCAQSFQAISSANKLNKHFIKSVNTVTSSFAPAAHNVVWAATGTDRDSVSFGFALITNNDVICAINDLLDSASCGLTLSALKC